MKLIYLLLVLLVVSCTSPQDKAIKDLKIKINAEKSYKENELRIRLKKNDIDFINSLKDYGKLTDNQKRKIIIKYYKNVLYLLNQYKGIKNPLDDYSPVYFYRLDSEVNHTIYRNIDLDQEISEILEIIEKTK